MKLFIGCLILMLSSTSYAQDKKDSTKQQVDGWRLKAMYGINGTQASFVNWNGGGRNSISVLGYLSATAQYKKKNLKWDNELKFSLGGLRYIEKGTEDEGLQKTEDLIDLSSNIGLNLKKHKKLYFSILGGFRTQFFDGYQHPNDSVRASTFMAPGYLNIPLGIDYTPNKFLTIFVSPFAAKMTFVRDRSLADAGAFGVDPAVYDPTTMELLSPGKMFRGEFGAYFKFKFNKEIVKNINMKSGLELFSNYTDHPENIDINADVLFTFKVNSWFSASFRMSAIYDHDIMITDRDGNIGPRTQFKSLLGMGVSYTMKNFDSPEKKK